MHAFDAELWRHDGEAGWVFATVPGEVSDDVRELSAGARSGFGSVRVEVTVGATTWRTSLFPDARSGGYLLPVKAAVRVRERLEPGDRVHLTLVVVDG